METTNISLDKRIVDDARLYAKRQGISLSELIERYLSRIVSKDKSATAGIPDKVLSLLGGRVSLSMKTTSTGGRSL